MSEWEEKQLNQVAELFKNSWKVGDERLPYIALEHIVENGLRINGIGSSDEVVSNKYVFNEETFLYGKLRPYFRKLYRPEFKGICSTDIWVVKPIKGNDKDFLFYFFANKEFVDVSYASSSGTRMPRADWKFMSETLWLFPPLPEQKAIAEVLSSLDDKIDLLHRQNQTLEQMAETLFRKWFVEEDNGEDWQIGTLKDEFEILMGQSPPGSSYNEEKIGMPMYQGNKDFGFRFPSNRVFTSEPKRIALKNDTLISVRAPVGAQNMANEECCIGRGVAAFRHKEHPEFYSYTFFKMRFMLDDIRKFNNEGTVFGAISKSDFEKMETEIPSKSDLEKIQSLLKPIDDKVISNSKQIQTLVNLRETLLPKLMSGEIRVNF